MEQQQVNAFQMDPQQVGMAAANANDQSDYLTAVKAELEALASTSFVHTLKIVSKEIKRLESGKNPEFLDLLSYKPLKLNQKVKVPIDQFPNVNFVGKLLGPGGSTLQKLQAESGCRMAIFGKGSVRNKDKEEELRLQGGKYEHLNDDLHVNVDAQCPKETCPAAAAYEAMGRALNLLSQYMDPEFEDMDQMHQMGFGMNGGGAGRPPRGMSRGRGLPRGGGMGGARGRGAPGMRGRGGAASGGGPIAQQAYTDFTSDDYSAGYGESSFGGQSDGGYYQGGARGGGRGGARGSRGAAGPMRGMSRGAQARPAPYGRGGARGAQARGGFAQY